MKDYQEFLQDLKTLIEIDTEKKPALPGKPFGAGIAKALSAFLDIAKRMGFTVKNYDNYIGEVSFGEGQEIGIIGHLDVVPAGAGWNTPPYQLTKIGDTFYGRGLSDDKAPTLLCLYALKALKESGQKVNKKFRLFVGCDEETGWQDVEYFEKNYSFPEYGFSPDGNFPTSYSEKGATRLNFTIPKLKNFSGLAGGTVANAVCARAYATPTQKGIDQKLLIRHGLKLDNGVIESVGKSAHGSHPELGLNAMKALFEYFLDMGEQVKNVVDYLLNDKAKLMQISNEQGNLTLSPGLLREDGENIVIVCDMRIPAPLDFEKDIKPLIDGFNIEYSWFEKHPPVMVDKEGWFVKALNNAYNEVYDSSAKPVPMGGSTFARVFKNGCAFGAEFPGEENGIHEPNERVSEKSLLNQFEIYKKAIFNLSK